MKKIRLAQLLIAYSFIIFSVCFGPIANAQVRTQPSPVALDEEATSPADLESQSATASAEASGAARLVQKITEKSTDLTETEGEAKGKLEQYVLNKPIPNPGITNFIQWSIRNAVMQGVPANTIVLVLLFPVITSLIAASRHSIGLRGFGIFTPALVAVGFLATGLSAGFILFFTILAVATAARILVRKLRLPYMPRTSLLLWVVSLTVLTVLLISPYIQFQDIATLSIFPILLMVLLAETFIDVQAKRSRAEAMEMTLETLLLAVVSYFIMNLEIVQQFVIANPEMTIISLGLFNIFLGKFGGLRLLEYWRFRTLLK